MTLDLTKPLRVRGMDGAGYEQVAMQIADLLQRVAENPCALPAVNGGTE